MPGISGEHVIEHVQIDLGSDTERNQQICNDILVDSFQDTLSTASGVSSTSIDMGCAVYTTTFELAIPINLDGPWDAEALAQYSEAVASFLGLATSLVQTTQSIAPAAAPAPAVRSLRRALLQGSATAARAFLMTEVITGSMNSAEAVSETLQVGFNNASLQACPLLPHAQVAQGPCPRRKCFR